jgi:hypothetical protein
MQESNRLQSGKFCFYWVVTQEPEPQISPSILFLQGKKIPFELELIGYNLEKS